MTAHDDRARTEQPAPTAREIPADELAEADLPTAESWFGYWETAGSLDDDTTADMRWAARVLHAEYDRRLVELSERDAELDEQAAIVEMLMDDRAELERLRAEFDELARVRRKGER